MDESYTIVYHYSDGSEKRLRGVTLAEAKLEYSRVCREIDFYSHELDEDKREMRLYFYGG